MLSSPSSHTHLHTYKLAPPQPGDLLLCPPEKHHQHLSFCSAPCLPLPSCTKLPGATPRASHRLKFLKWQEGCFGEEPQKSLMCFVSTGQETSLLRLLLSNKALPTSLRKTALILCKQLRFCHERGRGREAEGNGYPTSIVLFWPFLGRMDLQRLWSRWY